MTTYTFVGPGGKEVAIEGPAGATPEQAMEALKYHMGASAPAKAPVKTLAPLTADPQEGMSRTEKLLVGAGAATDRAARGIAGLFDVGGVPGNKLKQYLEEGKETADVYEKNHPGGWATTGEIGADLAMGLVPVAKGAQVANKVASKVLPKAVASVGASAAANSAYNAATAPEDRGIAAALGAGGAVLGRTLNRGASGVVKPTTVAQEMMDQGVRLTPGQAGGGLPGAVARTYEDLYEGIPLLGRAVTAAKERGIRDLDRVPAEFAETIDVNTRRIRPGSTRDLIRTIRSIMAWGGGHATIGTPAAVLAVSSLLGTTEAGRKVLLGQLPWQKFAAEHPGIAAQAFRAITAQSQPMAEEEN